MKVPLSLVVVVLDEALAGANEIMSGMFQEIYEPNSSPQHSRRESDIELPIFRRESMGRDDGDVLVRLERALRPVFKNYCDEMEKIVRTYSTKFGNSQQPQRSLQPTELSKQLSILKQKLKDSEDNISSLENETLNLREQLEEKKKYIDRIRAGLYRDMSQRSEISRDSSRGNDVFSAFLIEEEGNDNLSEDEKEVPPEESKFDQSEEIKKSVDRINVFHNTRYSALRRKSEEAKLQYESRLNAERKKAKREFENEVSKRKVREEEIIEEYNSKIRHLEENHEEQVRFLTDRIENLQKELEELKSMSWILSQKVEKADSQSEEMTLLKGRIADVEHERDVLLHSYPNRKSMKEKSIQVSSLSGISTVVFSPRDVMSKQHMDETLNKFQTMCQIELDKAREEHEKTMVRENERFESEMEVRRRDLEMARHRFTARYEEEAENVRAMRNNAKEEQTLLLQRIEKLKESKEYPLSAEIVEKMVKELRIDEMELHEVKEIISSLLVAANQSLLEENLQLQRSVDGYRENVENSVHNTLRLEEEIERVKEDATIESKKLEKKVENLLKKMEEMGTPQKKTTPARRGRTSASSVRRLGHEKRNSESLLLQEIAASLPSETRMHRNESKGERLSRKRQELDLADQYIEDEERRQSRRKSRERLRNLSP